MLQSVADNINGKTLCAFGDAAATPVLTTLKWFKPEFEAYVKGGHRAAPATIRRCESGRSGAHRGGRSWATHPDPGTAGLLGIVMTVCFFALQMGAAVMVYAERKVAAFMQQRLGPYLVGPKGCSSRSPISSS